VLRDLTLRSASSFGAFHLIRLLFDEYLFYSIEHKVAAATGVSVIAAFGNIKQVGNSQCLQIWVPMPALNFKTLTMSLSCFFFENEKGLVKFGI